MFKYRISKCIDWLGGQHRAWIIMVMIAYFVQSFTGGLLKGGRWDLYQPIAMADRFLAGNGLYYSAVEASTPYFPGVAFLAVFIGKFFYPFRDYILLFIASAIGVVFMYVLVHLGNRVTKNRWIPICLAAYAAFVAFPNFRGYMNEFKADCLILILGFLISLIIDKAERGGEIRAVTLIGLFVLSFVMDVFKQHALYIDAALGLYLLFSKNISIKKKAALLTPMLLGGIACLFVIFSIPNIEIQTIRNTYDMPIFEIREIFMRLNMSFSSHFLFFALLLYCAYLLGLKKLKLDSMLTKWLVIAVFFGFAEIAGGIKIGGTLGNFETGMINFLPFSMLAAEYLFDHYIVQNMKRNVLVCGIVYICFLCVSSCRFLKTDIAKIVGKIHADNEVSEYLSENLSGKTIMYHSNQYMQVIRSTAIPGMDIGSVPRNIKEYYDAIDEALREQTYEYLYINPKSLSGYDLDMLTFQNYEIHTAETLEKYYEVVDEPDMPNALKGQLFKAK